jgi:HEAT repeat protein
MSAAPWAELLALAERERELVEAGRWDEAVATSAVRLAAAQALGAPPPEARPHLERLHEVQAQITASIASARAFTLQRLGDLQRSRTAVAGYLTAGYGRPAARVDNRG